MATFDEGLDGFIQSNIDMLDWTRHYGPVLSIQTGPRADHTSGKGEKGMVWNEHTDTDIHIPLLYLLTALNWLHGAGRTGNMGLGERFRKTIER